MDMKICNYFHNFNPNGLTNPEIICLATFVRTVDFASNTNAGTSGLTGFITEIAYDSSISEVRISSY